MSTSEHGPLHGRHAVVTGGGRGIGAAIASALASAGADVTLMGRTQADIEAHAAALRRTTGVRAQAVVCDVSDPKSVAHAFDAATESHGLVDILVNNAGVSEPAPSADATLDDWNWMLAVNLTGPFLCIQQVLPAMLTAGAGRIVNVASIAGLKGFPMVAGYCASKHGVVGLTRALAVETAPRGVTVNAVCPGYTEDTDMLRAAVPNVMTATGKSEDEARSTLARHSRRGTLITPEEVADAVLWLCGPGASAITGQSIAVAAGEVM
jgi:NAD(P)-dependent dehydrogenase (short-subunit alcohol dehydrogenase family)